MNEHISTIVISIIGLFSTGGFFYMVYDKKAQRDQTILENDLQIEHSKDSQILQLSKQLADQQIQNAVLIERDKYKDDLMEKLIALFIAENPQGSEKFQSWLNKSDLNND